MSAESDTLTAQVEELLQFVYLMPVAIVKMGAQGEVQLVNPKAVQLLEDFDIDLSTQDGLHMLAALAPELPRIWHDSPDRVGEICAPIQIQRHIADRPRHFVLKLVRPDARCTMLVIEDVTAIVEKEREISRQKQRFSVVMEQIEGYCVVMLDTQGHIQEWNPSIDRMFGTATQDLEGHSIDRLLDSVASGEADAVTFEQVKATVDQQGSYRAEAAYRTASDAIVWGDMVATPTVETSGRISGYVFVIRDITEQRRTRERLLNDAQTDPLTGLLNRRGLEHRASLWLGSDAGKSRPSSWVMADIDYFKKVNDTYGHDAGDEVLKAFATLLKASARDGDIIARLGGEEFLILLAGAPMSDALKTAERMRALVAQTLMSAGATDFFITSSFGVVEQGPSRNWHEAITAADVALYEAKTSGRNCVVAGP